MAQSLLIGLGGTGSRVVNNVVRELQKNGKSINDGKICCAVLDTNCSDMAFIEETGTSVPVIGTSKPQKIKEYYAEYPTMKQWGPESPAFLQRTMIEGAGETRVMSRIAFEDCAKTGIFRDLEDLINEALKVNNNSKIRIMLVSSLSGGTGSGMFIEVALWLRKILAKSEISIRGIFLMPDVFISTIKDIRDNETTKVRHHANAYAAIRELNAITKVMQGSSVELEQEFELGDLFNSTIDRDQGVPVFDYAFFVDNKDSRGVHLSEISDYEKMVAQLVYMQLYSPMVDDMCSEEDNLFQAFVANDEPKYGACGVSKAVYPVDSVRAYSAMRAVQDSLKNGWQRIDDEIAMRIEEKKQEELERGMVSDTIDPRYEYVRLFEEKISVSEEEAGRDRFFLSLGKEAKNESKGKRDANGKVPVTYTDKVEDFFRLLKVEKIDRTVLKCGRTGELARNPEKFIDEDHEVEAIKKIVKGDEEKMNAILDEFDKKVDEYATSVVNTVFPYSMGDVAEKNRCSIHGMMTKPNEMGGWDYIHPIVARYLCYRLVSRLELALTGIDLETSREDAVTGGDENVLIQFFDNPKTPEVERSATEMAESRRWFQGETAFMDKVEKAYMDFMANKIERCDTYQKECLQVHVYRKLLERLKLLIRELEAFFESLPEARRSLEAAVDKNVESTASNDEKILYVYATRENKEQVYNKLDLGQNRSNTEINKSVLNAAYGRVCALKRPSNEENAAYLNVGAATAFLQEAIRTFRGRIDANPNNMEKLDLDLYTAICRESDAKAAASGKKEQPAGIGDIDLESGVITKNNADTGRHEAAFIACQELLKQNAAPCLQHEKEVSENDRGTKTARPKVFWGYHPALVASCSILGKVLGINTELQANDAYPKNELHCYSAVYGMEARYIPKFNEMNNGEYYMDYKFVIDEMEANAHGKMGERAYVRTPHLDKRWHRILPFVTEQMQSQEATRFFRGFWLGVAYGYVKMGKDGNMYVRRTVDAGYGHPIDEDVPVCYNGKPVGKTEVAKLVAALRMDTVFTNMDLPRYEAMFAEELDHMDTYIGTKALQGLVKKNEYLQPVDMITRYCDGANHRLSVVGAMVAGLESIAADLVANYYRARTGDRSDIAKYKICKRIHAAASRKNLKINAFSKWEEKFEELKITDETED